MSSAEKLALVTEIGDGDSTIIGSNKAASTLEPEKIEFVNKSPIFVVLQNTFDCDDICERNRERLGTLEFDLKSANTKNNTKMPAEWPKSIRDIGAAMIDDVFRYVDDQDTKFNNVQKLSVAEIFLNTLKFFVNTKTADARETVVFFEEQLLRYAVEHAPKSFEIFSIPECFVVMQLFAELILPHLALLRGLTARNITFKLELCDPTFFVKKVKDKKKK